MVLGSSLVSLGDGTLPASFAGLKSHIDIKWILGALTNNGVATVRRRKLPMDVVVWLVIGIALYRDRPIEDVVRHLDLVEPDEQGKPQGITKGAIPQARERLGEGPLEDLFGLTAVQWGMESGNRLRWKGLMVLGVDGSQLPVPDTKENRREFEGPTIGTRTAGYPKLRIIGLMVLRSHVLLDFACAGYGTGELTMAKPLLEKVPPNSLTILDRYYPSYNMLYRVQAKGEGRHWLVRGRRWNGGGRNWRFIKTLAPGDTLVKIRASDTAREDYPDCPDILARAIRYKKKGFRPNVLLTSLLDPGAYPAEEIVGMYHERWELEVGYDEIKTHALERLETIRSKTPELVRQEVWGLAIAYNLVRREMDQMAVRWKLPPRRISFQWSLRYIRDLFAWAATASPGSLPKMVERMRLDLRHAILPERRTDRKYPRWVKKAESKYAHKPGHPL